MRHAVRLLSLALAASVAFPSALRADETTSPIDAVEDRALREEAHARYEEALGSFQEAFRMSVEAAAGSADAAARGRARARAEAYLEKIDGLSGNLSRHRDTEKFLSGFDGEALGPVLKGWVDWRRGLYLRRAGRMDEARKVLDALGMVSTWWIVGPFDNERGRGFGQPMGPESAEGIHLDLDATYQGKERGVSWRRVPAVSPYGWVDLDAMLRPNDQCLAYAVTWIHSEEGGKVALRFGSDEGLAVWVNGGEVLRRDLHRHGQFEQDVVGVELVKGWNRILLKVGENLGAWGFRMRVTAPEGAPMADVRVPATEAEIAEAARDTADAPKPATFAAERGAADALAAAATLGKTADEGTEDARAYFWMGLLHRARQYDDMKEAQTDRRMLERAAKLRPDDPVYRFHAAEAATRPIEMDVEKEENAQRRGREKAVEMDPKYAEAYYALANYYTNSLRNLSRAEEMIRKALAANDAFLDAHLLLADILRGRGFETEAEIHLRSIFDRAEFKGRTRLLRSLAEQGNRKGLLDAARDAYTRTLDVDAEDGNARGALAGVLAREGLSEDAVGVYDERIRRNAFDVDAYARKAGFLEGLGRLAEAAAAAADGLAICPESDGLLELHGRALHRMGKKDEALARWKESLRVNPKDTVLKRYVEFLDPSARPFETPFVEDAATVLAAVRGKEDDNPENDPSVVVLDKTVTRVNPDGTSSAFTQKIVKILNNRGVKANPFYSAGRFWASDQAFEWRTARVWRKDGTVEEAQVQSGASWVRWPRLQPGDAFEVQHRVDELQQSFFGDFFGDVMVFTDQVPVVRSEYLLLTPTTREFFFHTRNMPGDSGKPEITDRDEGKWRLYKWSLRDLAKVRQEPLMPAAEETQPMVQVSTYRDWDQFATWWWSLIKKQFVMDDDMRAKVQELVAGAKTREDKVRAIYNFVVTDIQYQAWEFGVHGYKPYTASSIFHRKFGDCKDKAILIRTLLGEVGIEAFPVLISAEQLRSEEDLSLALVHHFNHCIAYVPDVDGTGRGVFLDGTAQYNSMNNVPSMDRGATVLIVSPEGGKVARIPWNAPEEFGIHADFAVDVAETGAATVTGTLRFLGDMSVMARGQFSVEGNRKQNLQEMLAPAFGSLEIEDMRFPDLKDITAPAVEVGVTLKAKKYGQGDGSKISLPVKFVDLFFGQLGMLAAMQKREHDLVFINPISFDTTATIAVPAGWNVASLPDAKSLETPFARFSVEVRESDGKVLFTRKIALLRNRVSKEEYGGFREMVTAVNNAASQKIVLEKAATEAPK